LRGQVGGSRAAEQGDERRSADEREMNPPHAAPRWRSSQGERELAAFAHQIDPKRTVAPVPEDGFLIA